MSYKLNPHHCIRRTTARPSLTLTIAVFAAGIIVLLIYTHVAYGSDQDIKKLNQFVQSSNSPAMKVFREGRDLIEEEQWARAAEKFNSFIRNYPKDRDIDAALYWLAYSLKKQGRFDEASQRLDQLMKEFPRSSWTDEARAMQIEIAPIRGKLKEVEEALQQHDQTASKGNDEIKIVALQSLFAANPERAISYVADIIKPGSGATRNLKEAAVSLLGSQGGQRAIPLLLDIARNQPDANLRKTAIHRLGDEGGEAVVDDLLRLYEAERDMEIKKQILHALSEIKSPRTQAKLLAIARSNNEPLELRKAAIHWLADEKGAATLDALLKIYEAEQNIEVRKQIIHALSDNIDPRASAKLLEIARTADNTEVRRQAIRELGDQNNEAMVDELMRLYESDRDVEIKKQILSAFANMNSPRAKAKLLDIARSGDNADLRRLAIRRVGEKDDPQTIELLVGLYDTEQSVDVKRTLLSAFGESKQKRALRKLIDVARSDPSVELRKYAVRRLGESKDPEALKFLEDILR